MSVKEIIRRIKKRTEADEGVLDIEALRKSTSATIAGWPEWKREYHEYKKRIRHGPDGEVFLLPEEGQGQNLK